MEIVITTFTAVLPGVTGADGAKEHALRRGRPEHESVTAELNESPTG
jgi:hypothetical protein